MYPYCINAQNREFLNYSLNVKTSTETSNYYEQY